MRRRYRTKSFYEKSVFGSFPNFCYPERRFWMNRISHPDWGKLCVELNYAPNQSAKIPSATGLSKVEGREMLLPQNSHLAQSLVTTK